MIMKQYNVTQVFLNGVDEATDLRRLHELTIKHPYVVWGVLISKNRSSKPEEQRYPSMERIDFIKKFIIENGLRDNFGIHICGTELVQDLFVSAYDVDPSKLKNNYLNYFKYIQINFDSSKNTLYTDALINLQRVARGGNIFVTQHNDNNKRLMERYLCHRNNYLPDYVHELIDYSGGEGIERPVKELLALYPYSHTPHSFGIAGGFGEHNLISTITELESIEATTASSNTEFVTKPETIDIWIDMESRIRNNAGWLDLDVCERILDAFSEYKAQVK